MMRPPPPFEPGVSAFGRDRGQLLEWRVFVDHDWIMLEDQTKLSIDARKRCRWVTGHVGFSRLECQHVAVAALDRAHDKEKPDHRPRLWTYCGRHLYGRWLEVVDGKMAVVGYRLRPVTATIEEKGFVARASWPTSTA